MIDRSNKGLAYEAGVVRHFGVSKIVLFLFLHGIAINLSAQAQTLKRDYYVNGKPFTLEEMQLHFEKLRKLETETKKLGITADPKKLSGPPPWHYTTSWYRVKPDHGVYCVCPKCRRKFNPPPPHPQHLSSSAQVVP